MLIDTRFVTDFSVRTLLDKLPVIDVDPPYQREGNVWSNNQKAMLIDTIVNGLDMPKLYFQRLNGKHVDPETGFTIQFAVLDGKQRLEAIVDFIEGSISLPDDFVFFEDEERKAEGMDYETLLRTHPLFVERIMNYRLPIVEVYSESGDLIEEMFLRLNTSTALNAAEKRNAISGKAKEASYELADHEFFVEKVAIRNARYKYRELSTKFLVVEKQLDETGRIKDTKAATLMEFFVDSHSGHIDDESISGYQQQVEIVLDRMARVFENDDRLLRSVGTLVVYYLAFRDERFADQVDRGALMQFEDLRKNVDSEELGEGMVTKALRRYNTFVQSTNDGTALKYRSDILKTFVTSGNDPDEKDLPEEQLSRDIIEGFAEA